MEGRGCGIRTVAVTSLSTSWIECFSCEDPATIEEQSMMCRPVHGLASRCRGSGVVDGKGVRDLESRRLGASQGARASTCMDGLASRSCESD